jgi:hypothetical protein
MATPSPTELRVRVAEHLLSLYRIGARAAVHPARLGQMLRERQPMSGEVARRVEEAINAEITERQRHLAPRHAATS